MIDNYRSQMLRSLVVNVPTSVDNFTTSPTVGIKINSAHFLQSIFKITMSLSIFMTLSCLVISCFLLPLQNKNNILQDTAKTITNKKFNLLVNLQEATTYTKLFSASSLLSFVDPDEVIHVSNKQLALVQSKKKIKINNYPPLQFAGF